MTFDFQDRFKDYATVDLINIINNPSDYQSAAVDAASQILKERNVSEAGIQDMLQSRAEDKTAADSKKISTFFDKGEVTDLLGPVIQTTEEIKARKWVNILLIVLAVQYLLVLYLSGKDLLGACYYLADCARNGFEAFGQCFSQLANLSFFMKLFFVAYTPVVFALIIKRKKLGWMLQFIVNLVDLTLQLGSFYFYLKYQQANKDNIFLILLPLMIRVVFVYFLWRNEIAAYFNISEETKKKTATATVLISLFYIGVLIMRS